MVIIMSCLISLSLNTVQKADFQKDWACWDSFGVIKSLCPFFKVEGKAGYDQLDGLDGARLVPFLMAQGLAKVLRTILAFNFLSHTCDCGLSPTRFPDFLFLNDFFSFLQTFSKKSYGKKLTNQGFVAV